MVVCGAPGDLAAPVVAEEDDVRGGEVGGEEGEVVGGALDGVCGEVGWGRGLAVADHVGGDDAEVEGEERGDLVAPAEGEVGEAVDEEDGGARGGAGRVGEEVVVVDAVEGGCFVLDSGVGGGEFVGSHGEEGMRGSGVEWLEVEG